MGVTVNGYEECFFVVYFVLFLEMMGKNSNGFR